MIEMRASVDAMGGAYGAPPGASLAPSHAVFELVCERIIMQRCRCQGFSPVAEAAQVDADVLASLARLTIYRPRITRTLRSLPDPMWAVSFRHGRPSASTCARPYSGVNPWVSPRRPLYPTRAACTPLRCTTGADLAHIA